jgi:hypothetical protein
MKRTGRKKRTAILMVFLVTALLLASDRHANRALSADSPGTIYVTDYCSDAVTAYPADADGDVAPLPPAPTGLAEPQSVALDQSGRIYAANGCDNLNSEAVVIYGKGSNGNVAPIATIGGSNTGLEEVTAVALDSTGNIYVSGDLTSGAGVAVFAPLGNSTGLLNEAPIATISGTNTGLQDPVDVVLDSMDHIFVLNVEANAVSVFSALGTSRGNLNEAPLATLSGSNTGLDVLPEGGMALDFSGNIYIPNEISAAGWSMPR